MTSIKVKVVRRPQIKVKTLVKFPANVVTQNFLTVTNSGGTYTFSVDYSLLGPGPVADPTTAYVAVSDTTSGIYRTVTLASLLTSGLDADLQAIAALTGTGILRRTGTNTWTLGTIVTPAEGGTGVNNGSFTVTLGGNFSTAGAFTISGAFSTTLTATATTNSTLPAGTHTLAAPDVTQLWTALQQYSLGNFRLLNTPQTGSMTLNAASTAASNTITFPAGTTDFSATGGSLQVVKQTSAGGAFTVGTVTPTDLSGLGAGVATFLATPSSANLRGALTDESGTGLAYFQGGDLGTPSAGVLTSATGLPVSTGVSGLGASVATFLATPSSANLRAALTDEVGTGAAYFVNGALGTPASGTATNLTGLPLSGLTTQAAFTFVGNNTSGSAVPTAVDIHTLTLKASPAATDEVIISDQAASGAWKRSPVSSLASASGVSSIAGNTGAFTLSTGITNSTNDIRLDRGQLPGETTTGNASAGNIGEFISSTVTSGSAVSLTGGTPANMTSVSLTAGDWDVNAAIHFGGAGTTTVSYAEGSINTASATSDNNSLNTTYMANVTYFGSINGAGFGVVTGTKRISLSGTTTVFAIAQANFGVSTMNCYGILRARRVR